MVARSSVNLHVHEGLVIRPQGVETVLDANEESLSIHQRQLDRHKRQPVVYSCIATRID
jgi:hypothetical protein